MTQQAKRKPKGKQAVKLDLKNGARIPLQPGRKDSGNLLRTEDFFFSIAAFATPMKAFNCLNREKQERAEYGVAL